MEISFENKLEEKFGVEVLTTDSIEKIRENIEKREKIPTGQQNCEFSGCLVDDELSIKNETIEYGNNVTIQTGEYSLPIEITIIGKLEKGTGGAYIENAMKNQKRHPSYTDEFNEQSALIGPSRFSLADPTAVYTFSVDKRDLVFHRHAGIRVITGVTGNAGCILKFSTWIPEEDDDDPNIFIDKMHWIELPSDCIFTLRFDGNVYHQFCPKDYSQYAFFGTSVHTNEATGLRGKRLRHVLAGDGSIPILTEPIPKHFQDFFENDKVMKNIKKIYFRI